MRTTHIAMIGGGLVLLGLCGLAGQKVSRLGEENAALAAEVASLDEDLAAKPPLATLRAEHAQVGQERAEVAALIPQDTPAEHDAVLNALTEYEARAGIEKKSLERTEHR